METKSSRTHYCVWPPWLEGGEGTPLYNTYNTYVYEIWRRSHPLNAPNHKDMPTCSQSKNTSSAAQAKVFTWSTGLYSLRVHLLSSIYTVCISEISPEGLLSQNSSNVNP